jgi:hypothetical protein
MSLCEKCHLAMHQSTSVQPRSNQDDHISSLSDDNTNPVQNTKITKKLKKKKTTRGYIYETMDNIDR